MSSNPILFAIFSSLPGVLISAIFTAIITSIFIPRRAQSLLLYITSSILFLSALGIFTFVAKEGPFSYMLGDWRWPFGIEFKLDLLSSSILLIITFFFVLYSVSYARLLAQGEMYFKLHDMRTHYSLIYIVILGFIGLVITGDLFNLYVFLEISSLASYALISLGNDRRALIGAFEYLILGTIGATLILIGIGLILNFTGTLNMEDSKERMANFYENKALILGAMFFIVGCLLKVALFPMHFWMVRAYNHTSHLVLALLGPITGMVGFYILVRFLYSIVNFDIMVQSYYLDYFLQALGIMAVFFGSVLALRGKSIRQIVIFSATNHVGYLCLLLSLKSQASLEIFLLYLFTDGFLKAAMLSLVCMVEEGIGSSDLTKIGGLGKQYPYITFLLIINLLSNAGLPLSMGFFNKIFALSMFWSLSKYIIFAMMVLSSIISLRYNYQILEAFMVDKSAHPQEGKVIIPRRIRIMYVCSSIAGIILLFNLSNAQDFVSKIVQQLM